MLFTIGGSVLVTLAALIATPSPERTMLLVLFAILLGCWCLFPSLTVVGTSDGLEVRFGIGPIRKRFRWAEIGEARPVRNSWLNGWGIRWIGSGWMYNVSGLDAVELSLVNGKRFRIGTDDPDGLSAFIAEQLATRGN